uniref:F-box domain-containing protein n=1 Tax=Cuerna arida TaxID=1464854 RepID=A0A1B6FJF5_9HEMI
MERQISLEELPQEVLTHIASYLTVQDILACSSTSTLLRYAFNDNCIWKKLCNVDLIDYLGKCNSLDDPFIHEHENDTSTLPPLCHWRMCYIKQANLLQNFKRGKYKKKEVSLGQASSVYRGTRVAFFESSEHLFIHAFDLVKDRFFGEIWDIKEVPFCHSSVHLNFEDFILMEDPTFLGFGIFELVGESLVICMKNIVVVYDVSSFPSSEIKLQQAFVFDKSEEISKSLVSCVNNNFVQNTYFEIISKGDSTICNNLFIGVVMDMSYIVLHFWDFCNGTKVREDILPTENMKVMDFFLLLSQTRKNIIVKCCVHNHRYMYHSYGYDIVLMKFSSFSVKVNYCDFIILTDDRVVGVGPRTLYLYNYKTSDRVAIRKTDHEVLKKTLVTLESDLLYGTFDSTIFVVKLETFELVTSVKLGFILYSLKVLCHRFVVTNSTNNEVWEFGKTAKKLFKLPTDSSFVGTNKYCTKIAAIKSSKLYILDFI